MNLLGYRKKCSTDLVASFLVDDISKLIDNKNMIRTLYIDLSKVCDTLNHIVLILNMKSYDVTFTFEMI